MVYVPDPAANPAAGLGPWRTGRTDFEAFPPAAVHGSITDRFLAIAEEHVDSVCLNGPTETFTYGQLADAVRRGAAAIRSLVDAGEPQPVLVLGTHDTPLVCVYLSVLAAGHIVVSLDPMMPIDGLVHAVRESSASVLLVDQAQSALADTLRQSDQLDRLRVASFDSLRTAEPADELPPRRAGDPAMLAFTSGTTGEPKAAVITHGVLLNLVRGATNALGITATDVMAMLFPTSLAVAAYPMFLPLLNGGRLATLDVRSVGLDPLAAFLEDERVTVAYMAPTVIRFCVDAFKGRSFESLRMLALGGELVDEEVVRLSVELMSPTMMANGFGTTETGVISLYVFDPADAMPAGGGIVPAGFAVEDTELFILADDGTVSARDVAGEIAVSSPYVFDGYFGHEALSGQVLADDPLGREGWRLYRTGDLGRVDSDGCLTVLGRVDTKAKIRGRFVVIGDVEADVVGLEGVRDAVVVARERGGVTELVAHVVADPSEALDPRRLRSQLLERRETYRVPSSWVVHDEFPRLPNGKTDRRALTEDGIAPAPKGASADEARRRDAERVITEIWSRILPMAPASSDDTFAELGGDSLLAAQMLILVERELGVLIPMGELLHADTIAALSELVVEGTDARPSAETVVEVQSGESTRPVLWFIPDLQGSAYRIRHLAAALGADQPVFSFESPLIKGEPNPYRSLQTFAARLLSDLLRVQPEGPYFLAGYSFGGICAYEMARQLRADGAEVEFCAVIDVGPGYRGPGRPGGRGGKGLLRRPWFGVAKPPPPDASMADKLAHYRSMWAESPARVARHVFERTGLAERVAPLQFAADLRAHGRVRPEWRLWYAWEEHWRLAVTAWDRGSTYDGTVDLFWASDTPSADNSLGWGPLVSDLVIHRFAGEHDGILEPRGATTLGRALRAVLDERLSAGRTLSGEGGTTPDDHPIR